MRPWRDFWQRVHGTQQHSFTCYLFPAHWFIYHERCVMYNAQRWVTGAYLITYYHIKLLDHLLWWKHRFVCIVPCPIFGNSNKTCATTEICSALLYCQQWQRYCQLSEVQKPGLNRSKDRLHCQDTASLGCIGKHCSFSLWPIWTGVRRCITWTVKNAAQAVHQAETMRFPGW